MSGEQTAFIGDVHGEALALQHLLQIVLPKARHLVFLGDLVNRGPDSRRVLDILLELRGNSSIDLVLLEGNHDAALADVLKGPARENEFLRMGGAATIQSYVAPPYRNVFTQLRSAFPNAHADLLDSLRAQWRADDVVARHLWSSALQEPKGRFVVAGHAVQVGRVPHIDDHHAFIDTGCGTVRDGRLTAFYWPSREWDQVQAGPA